VTALFLSCLATALVLAGCGGDDDGSGPSGSGFLFDNNAQFNGGRTVRWPALPIRVFLGNGVATPGEVTVWTAETGGQVQFAFVGSASAAGIVFRSSSRTDICGETLIEFTDDGQITSAEVDVSGPIYRGPQCVRTVTHETAHAIGFLSHTDDGGLMDDDGGNGEITPPVAQMFRDLYSLAPGTVIGAQKPRPLGERRPGGRNTMRFVYPVRR
jgi:hypothetical protein